MRQLLLMQLGGARCALRGSEVCSVEPDPHLYRLPVWPPTVAGISRSEGQNVLVLDLAICLGADVTSPDPEHWLLRLEGDERPRAFEVRCHVQHLEVEDIDALPLPGPLRASGIHQCVRSETSLIPLIDASNLWNQVERTGAIPSPRAISASPTSDVGERFLREDIDVVEVTFRGKRYALPDVEVGGSFALRPYVRIPNVSAPVVGVAEDDDRLLPVVDIAGALGLRSHITPDSQMVVVENGDLCVLVLVDTVAASRTIRAAQQRRIPPQIALPHAPTYGCYIDDAGLCAVLNVAAIVTHFAEIEASNPIPTELGEPTEAADLVEPSPGPALLGRMPAEPPVAAAVASGHTATSLGDAPVNDAQEAPAASLAEPGRSEVSIRPETGEAESPSKVRVIARTAAKTSGAAAPPAAEALTSEAPTSGALTSEAPTSEAPTSEAPTSEAPTSEAPTSEAPTSEALTSEAPTSEALTSDAPTSEVPTESRKSQAEPDSGEISSPVPSGTAPAAEAPAASLDSSVEAETAAVSDAGEAPRETPTDSQRPEAEPDVGEISPPASGGPKPAVFGLPVGDGPRAEAAGAGGLPAAEAPTGEDASAAGTAQAEQESAGASAAPPSDESPAEPTGSLAPPAATTGSAGVVPLVRGGAPDGRASGPAAREQIASMPPAAATTPAARTEATTISDAAPGSLGTPQPVAAPATDARPATEKARAGGPKPIRAAPTARRTRGPAPRASRARLASLAALLLVLALLAIGHLSGQLQSLLDIAAEPGADSPPRATEGDVPRSHSLLAKADTPRPERQLPEATPPPPELAPPELAPPELAPPELAPPELAQPAPPELAQPAPPELAPPELTQTAPPEPAPPELAQPEPAQPELAQPAPPEPAPPEPAPPELAQPELAQPELAQPELAQPSPPEPAPPEPAPPELAQPELAPPELAPPELAPPELAPPELAPPGAKAPSLASVPAKREPPTPVPPQSAPPMPMPSEPPPALPPSSAQRVRENRPASLRSPSVPGAGGPARLPGPRPRPASDAIVHVVVRGDTLWDLCELYLGDPFDYPRIARDNAIPNPHLIEPGQVIRFRKR